MVCFSVTCTVPWYQLPVYEPGVFWAPWLSVTIIKVLASEVMIWPLLLALTLQKHQSLHLHVIQLKSDFVTQSTWDTGLQLRGKSLGPQLRKTPPHMQQGPDLL